VVQLVARKEVIGALWQCVWLLLDDSPLPPGESSSSALTVMAFHTAGSGGKDSEQDSRSLQEVEKGLLMLIVSDAPGLQFAGL